MSPAKPTRARPRPVDDGQLAPAPAAPPPAARAAITREQQRVETRQNVSESALAGFRRDGARELGAETLTEIFLVNLFAGALAWCAAPTTPLEMVLRKVVDLFLHGVARGRGR